MARRQRKDSGASKQRGDQSRDQRRGGRDSGRPDRKRRGAGRSGKPRWLTPADVHEVLSGAEEALSASAVARQLGLPPEAARDVAAILRELRAADEVIEPRPGRFVVAGAGGEFPVTLIRDDDGQLAAVFPDERVFPVDARHSLGAGAGDEAIAMIAGEGKALLVRMVRRFGRELVGSLRFLGGGRVTFVPDNRREGELPMLDSHRELSDNVQAGDRVVVRVDHDGEGEPAGRLVRVLDESSPEVADFELVRLMHDLPGPFEPDLEAAAATAAAEDVDPGGRRDLRDMLTFTIDPETAKDFDDAISLERTREGWRVGVHIADVSHYVREGDGVDTEAVQRGTSCYLVNRVIPMLPEVLSNGACSLRPDEDRYALSVFIDLDKRRRIKAIAPMETVIRSRQRLTYEQALDVIERREPDVPIPTEVVDTLRQCHRLAQELRADRERAGALNLYSVEHNFALDAEGNPIEVERESGDVAHQLIEEFMLLANRSVASWLGEAGTPCVYRVHGEPDEERLEFFRDVLESYGIHDASVADRGALQQTLQRLAKEPDSARLVLNYLCLRSFQQAIYDVENIGHYALAFEDYCHFTSPIRRYPDLLVHRLVKRTLGIVGYETCEARIDHLDALARQCSHLERRAVDAERDLDRIKAARYLQRRIGDSFSGVVMGAAPHGLFLQLLETGLEGMLPVRELGDDYYEYDPERLALVGRGNGRVLGIGLELDVQVIRVDIARGQVDLGLDRSQQAD